MVHSTDLPPPPPPLRASRLEQEHRAGRGSPRGNSSQPLRRRRAQRLAYPFALRLGRRVASSSLPSARPSFRLGLRLLAYSKVQGSWEGLETSFCFLLDLPSRGKEINLIFPIDSKYLDFVSVMTLRFLHGVLVSFQCLSILVFCCNPSHEHLLDHLYRSHVPHFR